VNEDCLKLTTYFGERDRVGDRFMADAFVEIYARHELQTSLIMRGVEGFGAKHHLHTDRLLSLSEDLPLVAVAVDTRPRIDAALHELQDLRFDGLVTLERARMLTGPLDAVELHEASDEATKLTIYVGRRERIGDRPPTRQPSTSYAAAASPAPPCCSASTAPRTASAGARASSAATRTSR
jgi:PII-like signaling protein